MPILIIIVLLITAGLVARFAPINPLVSFASGLGLGMLLVLFVFQKLGKSARKSLLAWEVFSKLSSYKVPTYKIKYGNSKELNNRLDREYNDIVSALKGQMGFPPAKAKEAASYALSIVPDEPLAEKIREALRYLGDGHKELVK